MLLHCRISLAQFELDIDASFEARLTAIFGPSGSGKTTILDANAGVKEIAEGEIEVNGRTLVSSARHINLSPRQKFVGYLPQEGALFPHLSVRQNILFGADRSTVFDKFKDISLDHVVNVLEIANLLDRRVTALSGSERRESHSRVRYCRGRRSCLSMSRWPLLMWELRNGFCLIWLGCAMNLRCCDLRNTS